MKKIIILCILITTTIITANAQFFIEGGVNLRSLNTEVLSSTNFGISPIVGYWLNENIAVGINPSVGANKEVSDVIYPEDYSLKNRIWMFSVFGRYKLWGTEKLSLLVETPVRYGISTLKRKENANTVVDGSHSLFSVYAQPLVSYKLSERFSMVATCNFLNIGFSSSTNKENSKSTINQFNFNAQSSLFDSLGNISIGFIYNFKNNSNH